jgi:hypothetical protein
MATHSFDDVLARFQADNQRRNELKLLRAADVPRRPVEWLWPNRIAIGKVTLLVGDPGLGKSLVALDIAARVSRGTPWPDEQPGARSKEPGETSPRKSVSGSPLPAPRSPLPLPSSSRQRMTSPTRSARASKHSVPIAIAFLFSPR